ncbi:MAG: DUF2244 domain-containing protein [Paracoccaceae bacterium]|jgi:uncharacterized membrane protein|nr:hypothetical protein [Marinovum sp.]MDG2296285.1 DUF2244 domain-containing protein [Paracoccaceae bacterium]|tara:strand:- start:519 stop:1013 length:495 start_codon:yes stop_codon:yes gene_type:complete
MPYDWIQKQQSPGSRIIELWPHNSLPPNGFAGFILATFALITLPLYGLMGTVVFWALLPFLMVTLGVIWVALRRSYFNRQILEQLTLDSEEIELVRQNPSGATQSWSCNGYWAKVQMHPKGGPVPNYVTLSGNGREVEIGAFLSEEERKALYDDLRHLVQAYKQ